MIRVVFAHPFLLCPNSGIMLFEMEGTLDLYSCTRRWMESGAHRVTGKRGLENER